MVRIIVHVRDMLQSAVRTWLVKDWFTYFLECVTSLCWCVVCRMLTPTSWSQEDESSTMICPQKLTFTWSTAELCECHKDLAYYVQHIGRPCMYTRCLLQDHESSTESLYVPRPYTLVSSMLICRKLLDNKNNNNINIIIIINVAQKLQ